MKFQRTTVFSAALIALALSACGGGEDETVLARSDIETASNPEFESALNAVTKRVYAINSPDGIYGEKLVQDGWKFELKNPGEIPNESSTIVYVNSANPDTDPKLLTGFFKNFKGTLLVDGKRIIEAAEQQPPHAVDASGQPIGAIAEKDPLTKFYEQLSDGQGIGLMGTALVRKSAERSVLGVTVDRDGNFNGTSWENFSSHFGLAKSAASNMVHAAQVATSGNLVAKTFDYGRMDAFAEIVQVRDGWMAAGRVMVSAFQDAQGKKFVQAAVSTGQGDVECIVQQIKCGVYPLTAKDVVTLIRVDDYNVKSRAYATGYEATINFNSAHVSDPIWEYSPSAAAWNTSDALQKDYEEKTWSEGFAIGGSLSLQTFIPSVSASYSKSNTFTKRTDRWNGTGSFETYETRPQYGSIPAARGVVAKSGISLVGSFRGEPAGVVGWSLDKEDITGLRKRFSDELMYEGMTCGRKVNVGSTKPRLSFQGYRPGVSAMFRAQDNLFMDKVLTGGIKWFRSGADYKYGYWNCLDAPWPWLGNPKVLGWQKSGKKSLTSFTVVTPVEYWVGANIVISDSWFTNGN